MKREKIVDEYICDCCGAEIEYGTERPSIFITANSTVIFEWWAGGDYCEKCGELLTEAIVLSIRVPERYNTEFKNKDARIGGEIKMINEWREKHPY